MRLALFFAKSRLKKGGGSKDTAFAYKGHIIAFKGHVNCVWQFFFAKSLLNKGRWAYLGTVVGGRWGVEIGPAGGGHRFWLHSRNRNLSPYAKNAEGVNPSQSVYPFNFAFKS